MKIVVVDETGTAVFILFNRDVNLLLKKSCQDVLARSFEIDIV